MTIATQQKRLDKIEVHLTPKEWAIRLADEARKYPDALAYMRVLVKLPLRELPMQRPYFAFEEQAGARHPGHKPEDLRARERLTDKLRFEYRTLQLLLRDMEQAMRDKTERIGMQAALRLSALQRLIVQDACGRMAGQAAAWIERHKPADAADAEQRQAILNELAAFTDANLAETPFEVLIFHRWPSPLAEWSQETAALLKDFFTHRAAVQQIQDEQFDGHPILSPDLNGELAAVTQAIQSAVATFNDYVKSRTEQRIAETNGEPSETKLAIDLDAIQARANGQWAADIAGKWMRDASNEALESDAERWEQCREEWL